MSRARHRAHNLSITIPANESVAVAKEAERKLQDFHVLQPIRIAPHVYLSGELCAQDLFPYDVVINVAREVQCPLPPASPAPHAPHCNAASIYTAIPMNLTTSELSALGIAASVRKINGKRIAYYSARWDHDPKLAAELGPLTRVVHEAVKADLRVLVHCKCGVSRSATLVLAYIMAAFDLDYTDAYAYVKKRHPELSPNLGLVAQLLEWQMQLQRN